MKTHKYLIIFILLSLHLTAIAQVKTKIFNDGIPLSFRNTQNLVIPVKTVEAPEGFVNLLSKQKADNSSEYLNTFSVSKEINLDFMSTAAVTEANGYTTYIMTINADKALNVSIQFSEFILSKNAVLRINTLNELTDSITAKENNKYNVWATRVYQGNMVTIRLVLPDKEKDQVFLKIDNINFGFKNVGNEYIGSAGASAPCNVNVLCSQGNGWANERNSVAVMLVNDGHSYCTGTLVRNTCNTNIPYVLMANHAVLGKLKNWVFQYQYWSSTCSANGGYSEDVQFNGCDLRASDAFSDFALVQMYQTPASNSGLFYSGWNRGAPGGFGTVCLHHPEADLMKISTDVQPPTLSSYGGTNNHWVAEFESGTVEPGSSGGPLYDGNHRIIGQLHGNQLNVTDNYCDVAIHKRGEFGRFDLSWTGGGTDATRLSNWLDPGGTGAVTVNSVNIAGLTSPLATTSPSMSGSISFCSGSSTYIVSGYPTTNTGVSWTSTNPNVASLTPSGASATLSKIMDGTVTITATLTQCGTSVVLSKTITVGIGGSINFTQKNITCENGKPYFYGAVAEVPSATNYAWYSKDESIASNPFVLRQTGLGNTADFPLGNSKGNRYFTIRVIMTNPCGTKQSIDADGYLFAPLCSSSSLKIAVSPNPASNNLNIQAVDEMGKISINPDEKIYELKIADKMGVVYTQVKYKEGIKQTNINISNLPTDIYILQVYDGIKWISIKIIKQ